MKTFFKRFVFVAGLIYCTQAAVGATAGAVLVFSNWGTVTQWLQHRNDARALDALFDKLAAEHPRPGEAR